MFLETKTNLDGTQKVFSCRRLAGDETHVVVLFIADRVAQVAELELPVGTVTFGHFWVDCPYNLYHWMTPGGETLGHYFNIADSTHISPTALSWRDLILDVLCLPGGSAQILDEDELPGNLPDDTRFFIEQSVRTLMAALPELIPQAEAVADSLWRSCFGAERQSKDTQ